MGQTRDEQTAYVGRRRASVAAPESGTPTTPYVGKRRAATPTLERPTLTLPAEPLPVEHSAPSPAAPQLVDQSASRGRTEVDTTTIERVLADLEPVDASTSFAGEDTVIIPLELTRQAAAGRRRAARRATRTGVLAKVPSAPVLVGLAAMTISVGGVMTTDSPDLVPAGQVRLGSVGALSGTDAIGAVRPGVVSRDGDRAAAESADLEAQVEAQAEQRNEALGQLAQKAEQRASVLAENRWGMPLTGYRLTATFGEYGLWSSYHTGLDLAAPAGTPLVAMARGVVTSAGYDGAYGNKTVFTLEDGTELWYAHQTSINVSVGDVVAPGDLVGTVGSTGNVTGPHLHLEVRPGGGDPVDPYAALVANGLTP
ncbi:M23 family metallopeptidase [uncultured Nocardioides sp.]|uniref:M23 family metallopeptidase n=1 Tax=uncultured Nocardioides sp. TaxID=198441 RepID=UPI000C563F0D|nr:hypothetical protein [Nocardioides sp.]